MRRRLQLASIGALLAATTPVLAGAGPTWPGRDAPAASAQQPSDEAQLRELAEQLLAQPYGGYGYGIGAGGTDQVPTVELLPGQQPSGLSFTLPVPPGGRLIGSAVRRTGGQPTGADVVAEAPGSPDAVQSFYNETLPALGWRTPGTPTYSPGGFQSAPPVASVYFCGPDNRESATLTIYPKAGGLAVARATVMKIPPVSAGASSPGVGYASYPGPCSATPPPMPTPAPSRLPALSPPPGVQFFAVPMPPAGPPGVPGSASATSAAMATTTQTPAELEALFAQQLQAAGWTRQAGRADGPLAWSLWRLPDEGDWQGFLMVLTTPDQNRRFLMVRADPGSASVSGGPATPGGGFSAAGAIPAAPGPPPLVPPASQAPGPAR